MCKRTADGGLDKRDSKVDHVDVLPYKKLLKVSNVRNTLYADKISPVTRRNTTDFIRSLADVS